jgi:hypothetical protein
VHCYRCDTASTLHTSCWLLGTLRDLVAGSMHMPNCSQFEHCISLYLQCCGCELDSTAGFQPHTLVGTVTKIVDKVMEAETLSLYRTYFYITKKKTDVYLLTNPMLKSPS